MFDPDLQTFLLSEHRYELPPPQWQDSYPQEKRVNQPLDPYIGLLLTEALREGGSYFRSHQGHGKGKSAN